MSLRAFRKDAWQSPCSVGDCRSARNDEYITDIYALTRKIDNPLGF